MADEAISISTIDSYVEKVRTRTLDLSFNELLDMYAGGELIIEPEYQRLFRWSEGKQSRFIESLILEMPVPPLFVIEIENGKYELIDGLQRLSSYLHFRGAHRGLLNEDGTPSMLRLTECDIAKELNDLTFESLPAPLKIRLKRSFIRVEVIRKESDKRLRYYMFKRLNTGGEELSEQELRNCTMRLLDQTFNNLIIDLSKNEDFVSCIAPVSEEKLDKKYDQELVLRFFAFKNYRDKYVHDVADFMTEYMELVSDPANTITLNWEEERRVFVRTFKVLNQALGDRAFSGYTKNGRFQGKFLSYHYESVALGIQPFLHLPAMEDSTELKKLGDVIDAAKRDPHFVEMTTGGGKNYKKPLEARIGFIVEVLRNHYGG